MQNECSLTRRFFPSNDEHQLCRRGPRLFPAGSLSSADNAINRTVWFYWNSKTNRPCLVPLIYFAARYTRTRFNKWVIKMTDASHRTKINVVQAFYVSSPGSVRSASALVKHTRLGTGSMKLLTLLHLCSFAARAARFAFICPKIAIAPRPEPRPGNTNFLRIRRDRLRRKYCNRHHLRTDDKMGNSLQQVQQLLVQYQLFVFL